MNKLSKLFVFIFILGWANVSHAANSLPDEPELEGDSALVEIEFEGVLAQDLPNGLKAGETLVLKGASEFVFTNGFMSSIVDKS